MKAVIAATAGVAVPMILQGCEGGEDPPSSDCLILEARECVSETNNCQWDPATQPEECELQEDFDDILFELTAPTTQGGEDSKIKFGNAEDPDEIESCEDYQAVPAQRCYAPCELPDFQMTKNGALSQNIRFEDMRPTVEPEDQFTDFAGKKVIFYLPQIASNETDLTPSEVPDSLTYEEIVRSPLGAPDWTPYGDAEVAGWDTRLQCEGWIGSGRSRLDDRNPDEPDPRFVEEAPYYVELWPNEGDESPYEFKCGGLSVSEWQRKARAEEDKNAKWYWENVLFSDKPDGFGELAWIRFNLLSRISDEGKSVELVQADLDVNKFYLADAFDKCSSNRNCGIDFTEHMCVKVEDFCSQFSVDECPTDVQDDMIPFLKTPESHPGLGHDYDSYDLKTAAGATRMREFAGTAYFNHAEQTQERKCDLAIDMETEEPLACAVHEEFVPCEAIGVPTQGGDEPVEVNVCNQIYAKPIAWNPATYDAYDLSTFSENYMIDSASDDVNPRGCIAPSSLPASDHQNSAFGYTGPTCTHPLGWDCSVAGEEEVVDETVTDDGDGVVAAEDDTVTDDDLLVEEDVPFVSAEKCVVDVPELCLYKPETDGACMLGTDYYTKYFEDNEVDTFVVTFKEVEEVEETDEGSEEGDETENEAAGRVE